MTARVLARSQLPQLVSPLFAGHHLVILVPTTADLAWAAGAAWEFARAAASGERHVLLVDLSLEEPALDGGAANRAPHGIADAFAADLPLADVARAQDLRTLHYIGRGTRAPDPVRVWSSSRWHRLARGFASEGALLILFAPPQALAAVDIDAGGIVVLAPDGYDPEGGTFPAIAERLARGTPLLGVVASRGDAPPPGPAARSPPLRRPTHLRSAAAPSPFRPRAMAVAALLVLAAVVAASALMFRPRAPGPEPRRSAASRIPEPIPAPAPLPNGPAGDSLYYSVQVAAYNTLARAMEHADRLERERRLAIVTPTRLGTQGLWYRVLVDAYPSPRAADSALQDLWHAQLLERPQGAILRTPEAYRIKSVQPRERAEEVVRGLRARGIPAYIVPAPDSTALVYLGAFDLPDQARAADSLLAAAGLAATLVQRMGTAP